MNSLLCRTGGQASSLRGAKVDVPDFLSILDIAKPREGEVFVDLGSGTGKAVLASACGFPEFSKCRGIELVQGLAEAATDHLRTAKTYLTKCHPSSGDIEAANANTDITLSSDDATQMVDRSPSWRSAGTNTGKLRSGGGRDGGGGRRKKASSSKAAGLTGPQLEALIADMLSRPPLLSEPLEKRERGEDAACAGRETTAGEIAALLVSELGHRRYKKSLHGYGGLQKFLVARKGTRGALGSLVIAPDGAKVTVAPTDAPLSPLTSRATQRRGAVSNPDERSQVADYGPVRCSAIIEQDALPCLGANKGRAVAHAADADALVPTLDSGLGDLEAAPKAVLSSLSPTFTLSTAALTSTLTSTPNSPPTLESSAPCASCDAFAHADGHRPTPKPPLPVGRNPDGNDGCGSDSSCNGEDGSGVIRRRLPEEGPLTCMSLSGVELVCGDIFEEAWDDAGVVYVASLLFDDSMMTRLSKCVVRLREGARVISLRPIPAFEPSMAKDSQRKVIDGNAGSSTGQAKRRSEPGEGHPVLRLLHEGVFRMSWQMARVYIYVRL